MTEPDLSLPTTATASAEESDSNKKYYRKVNMHIKSLYVSSF